jgi:nucleoside-diphosphate-sugar epimerase
VVTRLLRSGCEVLGVARRRTEKDAAGIPWVAADVSDPLRMQQVLAEAAPEIVVHLASHVSADRSLERVLSTFNDNLLSTVGVLVAAKKAGCRRVVIAGSMEEPDIADPLPTPASPYAAAKWAAGAYARMFSALYGLPVVVVKIAMAYGPGQSDPTKLVPYVVRSMLRGEPPRITSGTRAVDWVYIDDVAESIERACFVEQLGGKSIDVGSGTPVTVRDFINQLAAIVDPSLKPEFGALPDRPLEREPRVDVKRTEALLGWRARTPLSEGLRRSVDWYRREPVG